jgi:hypothetical protein
MFVLILRDKEQRAQTDLLNVHPNEDMLDGLWEKETAGIARGWHVDDPSKHVLVQHVEEEECGEREAVNNRRYNGVAKCDDNEKGRLWEQGPPLHCARSVLDAIDGPRCASKDEQFYIVQH